MSVVIVTGASRGIGFATARAVLELGGCVVAVARSANDALRDKLASSFQGDTKGRIAVVPGDVTDASVCDSVIDVSLKQFGKVDAVIHNAGILEPISRIADADYTQWKKLFDVNLFAVFLLTQKLLPHLRKQCGRIVLVSSGAADKAYVGWSAYCCSKAAFNMLSACLADEEPDITSIAVRPGVVDTDMQRTVRDSGKTGMRAEDHEFFVNFHKEGNVIAPEYPGEVLAKLAVQHIPKQLNGKFVSWDSEELKSLRT